MKICNQCNQEIDLSNNCCVEVRREILCQFCFQEKYALHVVCESCQLEPTNDNPFVEVNSRIYCLECAVAEFEIQD